MRPNLGVGRSENLGNVASARSYSSVALHLFEFFPQLFFRLFDAVGGLRAVARAGALTRRVFAGSAADVRRTSRLDTSRDDAASAAPTAAPAAAAALSSPSPKHTAGTIVRMSG